MREPEAFLRRIVTRLCLNPLLHSSGSCSGKFATVIQMALYAASHGMRWMSLGLPRIGGDAPGATSLEAQEGFLHAMALWTGTG